MINEFTEGGSVYHTGARTTLSLLRNLGRRQRILAKIIDRDMVTPAHRALQVFAYAVGRVVVR